MKIKKAHFPAFQIEFEKIFLDSFCNILVLLLIAVQPARPCGFFATDDIMSRSQGWARATTSRGEGGHRATGMLARSGSWQEWPFPPLLRRYEFLFRDVLNVA